MSIKFKILFSYLAMLIVPIILTILVGIFAGFYYFGDLNSVYGNKMPTYQHEESDINSDLFANVKLTSIQAPDSFLKDEFLESLEEKSNLNNSGIVVRKDDDIIYKSESINSLPISKLPTFGKFAERDLIEYNDKKNSIMVQQQDFYFSDGSPGSVFIVYDVEPIKDAFKNFSITFIVAAVIILLLTNGFITFLVARSIIKPIKKLEISANKIKDGNLDFSMDIKSKDELGELSRAFDAMRENLKESKEIQDQYEKNRKELIVNISHDLKTPITAIKGYVEGIRDGVADTEEKMNKYLNTVYVKSNEADKLIDELFLYSKLDLNKLEFDFSTININNYLSDSMEELSFDLKKNNIKLEYKSLIKKDVFIKGDCQQIKRVIVNIIENSSKYMDKEYGKIDVKLEDKEDFILLKFKDNGRGIDVDNLPYIFDRFYRADSARGTATGGSGLGLSIAKKIINGHGGDMWADSTIGEGTTIYFTLKKIRSGEII
ncbi:MAG: sensor histidine kinase [Clostridiaceae bacterium]